MNTIYIVVLSLSGLLTIYGGSSRAFKPFTSLCLKQYLDHPDLKLEGKTDVLNEMRAAGSSIAFGGITMLLGAILPTLRMTAFIVGIVIFLGHAVGRLVSLQTDGKPGAQMAIGLVFDLSFGILNTLCLLSSIL